MLRTVRVPRAIEPIFESAQRHVREYFRQACFDPERGRIDIAGQRYTLLRAGALSVEFFDVVRGLYGADEEDGQEAASVSRTLLFDLAHALGLSDAKAFAERMKLTDPLERLSAGPVHFAHTGWAFVDILPESNPVAGDEFLLVYDHPYSFESDAWLAAGRASDTPVCVMNAGYSSGWCESSFGLPLVATEITCRAKGDDQCRFVMAPPAHMEERIRDHLADHPEVARQAVRFETPDFFARIKATRALHERARLLGEANRELEARVEQRTAELVELNRALERELAERRSAEAALRRSQQLNQRVQELMPGGIVHVAADGQILSANREALRFLGLRIDELTRKVTTDFETETIYEDGSVAPAADYPVSKALAGDESQRQVTLGVRRPDGQVSWGTFTAVPLRDPDGGHVTGAIVTFLDITERKAKEDERRRLEAKMQHAQKLESLGVLAGGVAHDFNNLLVGILGHASLLREQLAGEGPLGRSAHQIELAATRAAELTQQLLAYSGRGRVQNSQVELSAVAREMLQLVRSSLPDWVEVEQRYAHDLPAFEADPAQIRQVIMNLILNGAEAIGEAPGRLSVQTGFCELGEERLRRVHDASQASPGPHVFVRVEDTGEGMDEETIASIFDPFYTTKASGQGLGLAAVLGAVRAHAGALDIRSARGRGSCFEVYFPASHPKGADASPRAEDPPSPKAARGVFLVADDEEIVRSLAEMALADLGLEVLAVKDGAEAVRLFEQRAGQICGVLLDLTMPVLDGVGALKQIRARDKEVPVIISSGYDRGEVMEQFPTGERVEFLPKPFRVRQLRQLVQRITQ